MRKSLAVLAAAVAVSVLIGAFFAVSTYIDSEVDRRVRATRTTDVLPPCPTLEEEIAAAKERMALFGDPYDPDSRFASGDLRSEVRRGRLWARFCQ